MTNSSAENSPDEIIRHLEAEVAALRQRLAAVALSSVGLTDLHRDICSIVDGKWPDGKPAGIKKMAWYEDIREACLIAGFPVSSRTVQAAIKNHTQPCENLRTKSLRFHQNS